MVCDYIPKPEELEAMTFQLAFATSEGVLLASDRWNADLRGRHGCLASKIKFHESENFMHCSSGDDFCNVFTDTICNEIKNGQSQFFERPLEDALTQCVYIARDRADEHIKKQRQASRSFLASIYLGGVTTLAFRREESITLWTVDTAQVVPNVMQVNVDEPTICSDANSDAVFFFNRYTKQIPNELNALIPLAVHTVLMAKSDLVDGVEIGILTRNDWRILDEEKLKPFIEMSKEIDADTLKRFNAVGRPR